MKVATKSSGILKARNVMAILDEIVECLDVEECLRLVEWIEAECADWLIEAISDLGPKMRFGLFQTLLRRFNPYVYEEAKARGRLRNFLQKICPRNNITGRNEKGDVNERWNLVYKKDIPDDQVLSQPGEAVLIRGDFYKNLWSLVETMHNPDATRVVMCRPGSMIDWQKLNRKFDSVLRIFEGSNKRVQEAYEVRQEPERQARRERRALGLPELSPYESEGDSKPQEDDFPLHYFTEPHLLPLAMMDPDFRKQILAQMYTFLHAMQVPGLKSYAETRPVSDAPIAMTDAKIIEQLGALVKRVKNQLTLTPSAGKKFITQLDMILGTLHLREEHLIRTIDSKYVCSTQLATICSWTGSSPSFLPCMRTYPAPPTRICWKMT
jgi:hypothetical protein